VLSVECLLFRIEGSDRLLQKRVEDFRTREGNESRGELQKVNLQRKKSTCHNRQEGNLQPRSSLQHAKLQPRSELQPFNSRLESRKEEEKV